MSLPPAVYLLMIGGIAGFFAGYIVKTFLKLIVISVLALFLAAASFDYIGIFNIDFQATVELISKLVDPQQAIEVLTPLIANLPLVSSFAVGCWIGFTKA